MIVVLIILLTKHTPRIIPHSKDNQPIKGIKPTIDGHLDVGTNPMNMVFEPKKKSPPRREGHTKETRQTEKRKSQQRRKTKRQRPQS